MNYTYIRHSRTRLTYNHHLLERLYCLGLYSRAHKGSRPLHTPFGIQKRIAEPCSNTCPSLHVKLQKPPDRVSQEVMFPNSGGVNSVQRTPEKEQNVTVFLWRPPLRVVLDGRCQRWVGVKQLVNWQIGGFVCMFFMLFDQDFPVSIKVSTSLECITTKYCFGPLSIAGRLPARSKKPP